MQGGLKSKGVDVLDWVVFMHHRWHLLYSKMVYRRLHYEKTDEQLNDL